MARTAGRGTVPEPKMERDVFTARRPGVRAVHRGDGRAAKDADRRGTQTGRPPRERTLGCCASTGARPGRWVISRYGPANCS